MPRRREAKKKMATAQRERLLELMNYPRLIRNMCILAHVDHGKTSIADSLLASNAIINSRMAGQLRYLDDRPDEQRRGITMKSSSIALLFKATDHLRQDYMINLIDSPGHVDFSMEVVSAARLSDGAFIVIDVVEGICPQTISAIEEAFLEKVKMILVLNKIDRLILEKKMTAPEIYTHLCMLVESVNATVAEMRFRDYTLKFEEDFENLPEQMDDEFQPAMRNVIFASAIDGWAFRLCDFATLYSSHCNIAPIIIEKNLFGDCFYDKRRGIIVHGAKDRKKKPLFISIVLDNLCAVYDNIIVNRNLGKVSKILERLKITTVTKDMNSPVPRIQLRAIMSAWLPLHRALFESCVFLVPSPWDVCEDKVKRLLRCDDRGVLDEAVSKMMEPYLKTCCGDDLAPLMGYIAKVVSVDKSQLIQQMFNAKFNDMDLAAKKEAVKQRRLAMDQSKMNAPETTTTIEEGACALALQMESLTLADQPSTSAEQNPAIVNKKASIGIMRVFSGMLRKGTEHYLLMPSSKSVDITPANVKVKPSIELRVEKIFIQDLYLMVGREMISVDKARAGNIVGIGDISKYMVRTGTVTSTLNCLPLLEVGPPTEPLYRTAIEPENPGELSQLITAIKQLMQIDSCVQCVLQDNGQYVLLTAGDVHLQKCLEDLSSLTTVKYQVSPPMVRLRETVQHVDANELEPIVYLSPTLIDMGLDFVMQVVKMPANIAALIQTNYTLLKSIEFTDTAVSELSELCTVHVPVKKLASEPYKHGGQKMFKNTFTTLAAARVRKQLNEEWVKHGPEWEGAADRLMYIGGQQNDCCVLLNFAKTYQGRSIWNKINPDDPRCFYDSCLINGFQLTISAGPTCDEPLKNLLFCVLEFEVDVDKMDKFENNISGTAIKEIRDVCSMAVTMLPARLMEPMFSTTMLVESAQIGKVHKILSRHIGRITSSIEITPGIHKMTAILPVLESQNFCNEIRMETSGTVNPVLQFHDYAELPVSPKVPMIGDPDSGTENRAYKLMVSLRQRKGLHVAQTVQSAEKQRTMNKKK